MSSKKFVYLFMMVAIVCGFVAADTAYGQSVPIATFKGKVLNADGTPAPGYAISAETVPSNAAYQDFGGGLSHTDGSYSIAIGSIGGPTLSVGDRIKITATDVEGSDTDVIHTLTVEDVVDNAGNVALDIIILGVTVTVNIAPSVFDADTTGTGTITVTVDRDGPVTDDTVTLSLSPAVGSVTSPATNNGDGTYTATYTSGTTAELVRITATATQAGGSGMASVTINAGPPAAIELSPTPETVTSFGRSIITAMVTDSNGNGVGALTLTGTTVSGGTLTNFASSRALGSYTATYTAPMVDAEGTETVTVMADGVSKELTLNLTPVPPEEVNFLTVEGTVYRVDGEATVDGVKVEITVGSDTRMATTGEDGTYEVDFLNPLAVVARGGDPVSIVVTDSTGGTHGPYESVLTNEELMDDLATVTRDVTTTIPVPPRSVSTLVVEGIVSKNDGETPADDVNVMVTVGSNTPQTVPTDMDGTYSVTFFILGADVIASKDDPVSIVVTDATGGTHGPYESVLTYTELGEDDAATVTRDVTTNIVVPPRSVTLLVVEGVVLRDDETTPVGAGFDVAVTVGSNPVQMGKTDADGAFSVTFWNPGTGMPVATAGDILSIVVSDSSGVRGESPERELKNSDLGEDDSATVKQDVTTNIGATSNVLAVMGTVYLKNGETQKVPATSDLRADDLTVVVTNATRNLEERALVDDDGEYSVTFFNFSATVAETGDSLTLEVEVLNEAGNAVGHASHTLTTTEVMASQAEGVDIETTVPAVIDVLDIVGSVIDTDGSPVGAGIAITITLDMNGHSIPIEVMTDPASGYNYTLFQPPNPVAATGNTLTVRARRASDQFVGYAMEELRSAELVDRRITVDPIRLVPPVLELGGLSINPDYTGIQDPMAQQLLNMDLAQLTSMVASLGLPTDDLATLIPPSLSPMISLMLASVGTYQLELPSGFDPDNDNIAKESFGNAITTRPTAWVDWQGRDLGRWVNGDQLNLYILGAPTINSATFTLNGSTMPGTSVPAGGAFPYTFQLEEEWIALFEGHMPAFGAVQLMIDGQSPIDMTSNGMGGWSAEAMLSPGSTVAYHYMVTLARPYHDPLGGLTISSFPLIDPRNRQVKIDSLDQAIDTLIKSELQMLEGVRSVFGVPEVNDQQSLWVATLPLDGDDGAYTLEVNVSYRGGYQEPPITAMFTVDRTPPTAAVSLDPDAPGHNAGMYSPADGLYVATALMPGAASLTVSISSVTTNEPDGAAYLYQLAKLDAAGNPGAWSPVVAADLLSLDLTKLISDPGSVLPLTNGVPVDMLIRNSEGGALYPGTYGLRAVGIDSLLNMDSGTGRDLVLELVPPDPDILEVTSVHADFNGDGAIGADEMQSTAVDVVVFSDSLVTLVVDVIEQTRHGVKSVAIEVEIPGVGSQQVAMFSGDQLAALGDHFPVTLPVPDIPSLPDRGGHVVLRTVTTNRLNVVNTQEVSLVYQRRTPPEVSGVHTYVTDRHPVSGAAQGTITIGAFTQAMTSPDASTVQFEYRRAADADWMPLGVAQLADTTVVSHVQIAIIEGLVNSVLSGAPSAPVSPIYREWFLEVDSATLKDTIMDDGPDSSQDDNPYVVRATAVDTAGTGYPAADGIEDRFSLDNYSPTAITQVANEVEMVAPGEDGSYHVSGLIHDSVPTPMLKLTASTGAHPNAFPGGLKLAVNNAAGEAVEIAETVFNAVGNHNYMGSFDLGSIPNGTYTFMAVGHTADGAAEERIVAMAITVEVGNFTPPENFADPTVDILSVVNTRGDAHSPSEIDAQYVTGFPAIGDEVCVTLIVPNVAAGDVDILIADDGMSAAAMGALTVMDPDANNNISVCLDTSGLDEGMYGLVGAVNKPNGTAHFGLPSIQVDRSAPVIEIVSPLEGHQVSSVPTVQVAYSDATGFDPEKRDPRAIEITLTRLGSHKEVATNPEMIRSVTATGEVLTQSGSISYTHDVPLAGGAYRIDVSVTDTLGHTGTAESVEFTSSGTLAGVSIITPAPGQVVDPDQPLTISAALSGNGELTVSEFSLNRTAATPTVENNMLTHTVDPDGAFNRGAGNTVTIKIVDEEGNTAEATSTFTLALDTTPPVVATYSPLGIIRTDRPIAAATVTDESGIDRSSLTIIVAGVPGNQGTGRRSSPTSTTVTFTPSISVDPGPYTARVTVEDVHGNRTEVEWQFTVELDVTPPAITTSSPHGVIRSDKPIISVSASDDMSGVDTIEIGVKGEGNQAVEGVTSVRSDKTSATFTPTAALTSGTYTVDVKLADMSGNKASGQWQFTVELDTIAPSIFDTRPSQEHTENRRPTISATYTDNMSGVDAGSVKLTLDGSPVEPDALSDTQVVFTPKQDLTFDQHTLRLQVSDNAGNMAEQEWVFYVERMGIADARNYPNPFDHETTIAFRVSRQASISIRIYDFTGRLVAQPITNSVYEAGLVEIDWHGETDVGDHLARGVYFCHILMESELEPQSAILKMAIISE